MAKKKETVTISKATMNAIEHVLDKYACLLDAEIDSCVNDQVIKKAYQKDLKEVCKLEVAIDKEIRPKQ
jgi:hypothetical protein